MASYQKITLPSGLRALTVQLPDSETATILVLVTAGSKYERKEINGVSHFLEHMLFKGTKKRADKKEIAGALDGVGASYNAFTGKEYTGYYIKVARAHMDLALDVVADIYLDSLVPGREIEKERRVILEELKMEEDTPMAKVGRLFEQLLYGDQPAGWPIGGTKETVANINHDHIIDYYKAHYVAPRTLVCIAGPWDHAQSLSKINSYFAEVRPENVPLERVSIKEVQEAPKHLVHTKSTDQTHLVLGFRAYSLAHPDRFVLEILSMILGGMMSSRLFLRVREEEGLAYYIHSEVQRYTDSGYLAIQAGVGNDKVSQGIDAILSEVSLLKREGISEQELRKAKDHFHGQTALSLEASNDWASFYGAQEILTAKILTTDDILRQVEKVTLEDITRVANDIFKEEKLNLALVGPSGKRDTSKLTKLLKLS